MTGHPAQPVKRPVQVAVIIPAGPHDDVADTMASVIRYTVPSRIVVVIDDTGPPAGGPGTIGGPWPDTVVLPAPGGAPGGQGGLWVKLATGYRWLLDRYEPAIILRLDADALIIGPGLEAAAETAFARDSRVGMLGSYRVGPDGGQRDASWASRRLRVEMGPRGLLHPKRRSTLRRCRRAARGHGYTDGESALGGAYLHRYQAAQSIDDRGWFSQPWLASSQLGEDHIMALLTVAAGHRIGDFGGPADPLALTWRGLPAHPADLLAAGKLVTHSVRSWPGLTEAQIRDLFARARS